MKIALFGATGRVGRAGRLGIAAFALAGVSALAVAVSAALPGPVAEPDTRPALAAAHPEQAVLQAVTRAGERLVAVGERGLVLLSDDGARTWRQAKVPVSVTLTAVSFPTPREGWAVGHFGMVLHSADGGESWQPQLDGAAAAKLVLAEAESRSSAGDADAARLLSNAQRLVADGPDKPFLDVYFADASHGIVVGAYNLILRTEDGGKTWQSIAGAVPNPNARHLYAIRAAGGSLYLAGETGLVFRSDDQGASFQRLPTPYEGSYFTLAARDDGAVVVAGLRGHAYRSADKGKSWEKIPLPTPVSVVASLLGPDGRLLLANQAGQLVASPDMGKSLTPLEGPPLPPVTGLASLGQGRLVATTLMGVVAPGAASAPAQH
jgi:photosystem II stability/assembly factor-like uncharacterized protein